MILFHQSVIIPTDKVPNSYIEFVSFKMFFQIELAYIPNQYQFKMVNVRLTINNSLTKSIDFTVEHLKSYPEKVERILLSEFMSVIGAKEILKDLHKRYVAPEKIKQHIDIKPEQGQDLDSALQEYFDKPKNKK